MAKTPTPRSKNRIISWGKLRSFIEAHPEDPSALESFSKWYFLARNSQLSNWSDVKRIFSTASFVGELVVFNIGGNKYRLAVRFNFNKKLIYVRRVMTHREYDRGDWQE